MGKLTKKQRQARNEAGKLHRAHVLAKRREKRLRQQAIRKEVAELNRFVATAASPAPSPQRHTQPPAPLWWTGGFIYMDDLVLEEEHPAAVAAPLQSVTAVVTKLRDKANKLPWSQPVVPRGKP
jgi:hypothetical protein